MRANRIITKVLILIAGMAVLCSSLPAQAQEVLVKGLIISRDGENMLVRGDSGKVTVTITKDTKTSLVKGVLGIRKEEMSLAALIPGLRVEIDAERIGNQIFAKNIKFKAEDLKTATEIQAGLEITRQQLMAEQEKNKAQAAEIQASQQSIQANQQAIEQGKAEDAALNKRFSELSEYDVKGEATVLFDVNSANLSEKAKEDLQALAAAAKNLKGYMIQVAGYTDSSGSADFNQELSDNRAESVIVYLRVSCNVPISRVLSPAAMGMARPVASNETAQGKAENRRVVAKILVNRGLTQ
jgi:OmpA-OmpF porin, OOP family